MDPAQTHARCRLRLVPFQEGHAATIAEWVRNERQLQWLAPATTMPLTAEKVVAWKKEGGHTLILTRAGDPTPIGYGELNPMRREPTHFWLGHAVLRPDQRGQGVGKAFVRGLVRYAFDRLAASRISLIVFPQNAAAVECYRRVGFTTVCEEYHQFGVSQAKHRMLRLEIRAPRRPGSLTEEGA